MCCSPEALPFGFNPLPNFDEKSTDAQNLKRQIESNLKKYYKVPSPYRARPLLRSAGIILTITAIVVGIMATHGTLLSFPQNFMHFVQKVNWVHASIAASVLTVLTVGAAILIHKVQYKEDKLTETTIGKLIGDDHWISALIATEDNPDDVYKVYIDLSTLNNKSGKAFVYIHKDAYNHYGVCIDIIAFTPLHMIGAIAYNILRLFVVPVYILVRIAIDRYNGSEITEDSFRLSDIPEEMKKTVLRIVKAPFYAMAIIYASLYAFIDPLNGRKLGAYLERDWNEGVTRTEGFWSVNGPGALWRWEGGWTRKGLGQNGYFIAGCWQPLALTGYIPQEVLDYCISLAKAIEADKGRRYSVFTAESLATLHNALIVQLQAIQ